MMIGRQRTISIVVATAIASALLWAILNAGIFNFIPYLIHREFFSSYNSAGESTAVIQEGSFIVFFDVVISLVSFVITYRMVLWLLTKGQQK